MATPCRKKTLAEGPLGRIEHCAACAVVTVHVGVLSFRLDANALTMLWRTLGEAIARLNGAEAKALHARSDLS